MEYDISGQRIDGQMIRAMFPRRERNAHKGHFGHALLVAGQRGMTGAALLATGAALRSGCGLVTAHIPADERLAVHILHPSAILSLDPDTCFSELPTDMSRYTAVGAGPGLGQSGKTTAALRLLMKTGLPMVLDADALNLISSHPGFFALIPPGSVLTPHIGELRRLLRSALTASVIRCPELSVSDGKSDDSRTVTVICTDAACGQADPSGQDQIWQTEEEKVALVKSLAAATGAVIVVKGWHTMVCSPDGTLKYNTTGNPGMAKGGSGDVLTGLITGLLARGFTADDAATAGVWLHGSAGDRAAALIGEESMNASDILAHIRIG